MPRLLAASDVYVLTSRREGLAFSLLEAMAHGLAPVVTDLPENGEAVGDAGILVRPDQDSVATAMRRLAEDADERADLGSSRGAARSRLFDATEMTERTRALYDDVLEGSEGGRALVGSDTVWRSTRRSSRSTLSSRPSTAGS